MKDHIINFKTALYAIPNEDLGLVIDIFLDEVKQRGISIDEIELALEDVKKSRFVSKEIIDPEFVLDILSNAFAVQKEDITGRSRKFMIKMARHAFRYIMFQIEWGSLDDISRLTDSNAKHSRHATIINSIKKIEALKFDIKYKNILDFCDNLVERLKVKINQSIEEKMYE